MFPAVDTYSDTDIQSTLVGHVCKGVLRIKYAKVGECSTEAI